MSKSGMNQLVKLAKEATRETGMHFAVRVHPQGEYKGTVRYKYSIERDAGPVTAIGPPSVIAVHFTDLMNRFREAKQEDTTP